MAAALLDLAVLAFAAWTLLCHAAVLSGGGLAHAVAAAAVLALGAAALAARRGLPAVGAPAPDDRTLWALGALCAAAVLIAHRPDSDDALYLGFAAGAADFPTAPLLRDDTLYGLPGLPIVLSTYRFHAIEPLFAAVSLVTGMGVLSASHLLAAPLWGFLAPSAWARLMGEVAPERRALGAAAAVAYLLADGSAHGGWGNLAFVRLFQGKAAFLTVLAPAVAAYALRFGREAAPRNWLLLAAGLVASAGLTSSALWAAPLIAGAAFASVWRPTREGWRAAAAFAAAAAHPLAVAWLLRAGMKSGALGAQRLAAGMEWVLLEGTAAYVTGVGPHRWALLAMALLAPAFAAPGAARRWSAASLGAFFLFFNPWLGPWAAANLTSPPNYYRVFWLLPMPAFFGLAAAAAADPVRTRLLRVLAAAVLLAAFVPSRWALSAANGVRLGFPGPKVPAEFPIAATVNAAVPPRARVLAPAEVSQWLVMERGHARPLLMKDIYFDELHRALPAEDIVRRRALMSHVGGERAARLGSPAFRAGLAEHGPGGVVLEARLPWADEARGDLAAAGYARRLESSGYELWTKGR